MIKTQIDLQAIKAFCDAKKSWSDDVLSSNCPKYADSERTPAATRIDNADTVRVLRKFYKFAWTDRNKDRSVILVTNKGTIIENYGPNEDSGGIWINGRDNCLGDSLGSWSDALVNIETTSDFLAQLAVFANKHAN